MKALLSTPRPVSNQRQIAYWLLICCALIFIMVVLGGVTRLTGSGLSMVEWDPLFGILPPLSHAEWEAVFAKYQQSPEFRIVNSNMDLGGFQEIFWLEYLHRVLGRVIGIVFLIPFVFFLVQRKIPSTLVPKLFALFVLGGLQGLLGWYMVKSGLVNNPHVSQYRLTAHLLLAVLVYGYMLWVALGLLFPATGSAQSRLELRGLKRFTYALLALIFLTIASGGFMAGLKAGFAYSTFPLMAGQWIPEGLWVLEPWPRNLFENITTVQFDHRALAMLVLFSIGVLWLTAGRYPLPTSARWALHALLFTALLQVALGISTLVLRVPIPLASAHQAGALTLFTIALFLAQRLRNLTVTRPAAEVAKGQTLQRI